MSGTLYTSWKDSLGVSHIDEAVATYENGRIYVAVDGFLGTIKKGVLIGEYEDGKVYSIGTGAFNYGKRLNLVAIIENGKIYSVSKSILGGISKSLSVGECSNGKVYSHSHKLMEGQESFGLYNGDEEGAAAAAAIALFKLKSDVSAYYDKSQTQDSSSNDDDLWEKYGLLMPIVATYRVFKYIFIVCKWIVKAIIWIVSFITKAVKENREKQALAESDPGEESCRTIAMETHMNKSLDTNTPVINNSQSSEVNQEEIIDAVYTDKPDENIEIQEESNVELSTTKVRTATRNMNKNKLFGMCISISIITVIIVFCLLSAYIPSVKSENEMRIDVQNHLNSFGETYYDVEKLVVTKRKTSKKDGTDVVNVEIEATTDEIEGLYSLILNYKLYEQGWFLEDVQEDSNGKREVKYAKGPHQTLADKIMAEHYPNIEYVRYDCNSSKDLYVYYYQQKERKTYATVITNYGLILEFNTDSGELEENEIGNLNTRYEWDILGTWYAKNQPTSTREKQSYNNIVMDIIKIEDNKITVKIYSGDTVCFDGTIPFIVKEGKAEFSIKLSPDKNEILAVVSPQQMYIDDGGLKVTFERN